MYYELCEVTDHSLTAKVIIHGTGHQYLRDIYRWYGERFEGEPLMVKLRIGNPNHSVPLDPVETMEILKDLSILISDG